jgi:hypothetical protein
MLLDTKVLEASAGYFGFNSHVTSSLVGMTAITEQL